MISYYSEKELKEMSTELLIIVLINMSNLTTNSAKQTENKVFKVLHDRKVIDYDTMKAEYERLLMW